MVTAENHNLDILNPYEANLADQFRVGYIRTFDIKGTLPQLAMLNWDRVETTVTRGVSLTDDPALTGNALGYLPTGTSVTCLTTMFNNTGWDYVETIIDSKVARGFLPSGCLADTTAGDDLK